VADAAVLKAAGEGVTGELRTVVGQHSSELDPDASQTLGDMVHPPCQHELRHFGLCVQ
jgi:hypothetical protein